MKKIFIALMATMALANCGKNDDSENPVEEGTFPKKVTYTDIDTKGNKVRIQKYEAQNGKILSATLTSYKDGKQEGTEVTKVTYEGNRLKQIKSEDSTEDFYYDEQGHLIKDVDIDSNNRTIFYAYNGNQLSKITTTTMSTTTNDNSYKEKIKANRHEEEVFVYSGNMITVNKTVTFRDDSGAVISNTSTYTNTTTYTIENGNVVKEEGDGYSITYRYDTHPNPERIELFKVTEIRPDYFIDAKLAKNNLIEKRRTSTNFFSGQPKVYLNTYKITYNTKGYPTKIEGYYKEDNNPEEHVKTTEYEY